MSQGPSTSGSAGPSSKTKSAASKSAHPSYATMIQQGLTAMQGKGASRQALLKYMMKNYTLGNDEKSVNTHLKLALKTGLEKGLLVQSTGKGATGSVKLGKKTPTQAAPAKKPKTAAAAKKPKASSAKVSGSKLAAKPKKVSLSSSTAKAKKPSVTKKSSAKVVSQKAKLATKKSPGKVAPKKTKVLSATKKVAAAKPKGAKAKVAKPKVTKAAAGKAKKPGARK